MSDLDDYVDLKNLHPDLRDYECWNCGHTGQRRQEKSKGAVICSNCYHGQGDEKVDYIEMWYPDMPRDVGIQRQRQMRAEAIEAHNRHNITVSYDTL